MIPDLGVYISGLVTLMERPVEHPDIRHGIVFSNPQITLWYIQSSFTR